MTAPPGPRLAPRRRGNPVLRWWRRGAPAPTPASTAFDAAFGLVLPLACLVLDPIVFRSSDGRAGMIGYLRPFAYSLIALEIAALAAWHLRRRPSRLLGGVLLAGAAAAGLIGCFTLWTGPFAAVMAGKWVGVLGVVPVGTAFVFARAGMGALGPPPRAVRSAPRWLAPAAGVLLAVGVPVAAQVVVDRSVAAALAQVPSDDPAVAGSAVRRLQVLMAVSDEQRLREAWTRQANPRRKAAYARAYRRVTGFGIEDDPPLD